MKNHKIVGGLHPNDALFVGVRAENLAFDPCRKSQVKRLGRPPRFYRSFSRSRAPCTTRRMQTACSETR